MIELCAPALIYIAFSLTQVIIDIFKGLYNTAFFKFIVMIVITFLLNALCQSGMSVVSWIIVFIPFIFMSVIVTILLYVFGLDTATGQLNFKCDDNNTTKSGNLIYSNINNANTNTTVKRVTYSHLGDPRRQSIGPPIGSSDPQYN